MKYLAIVLVLLGMLATAYGLKATERLNRALAVSDSLDLEILALDSLNQALTEAVALNRVAFARADSIAQEHRQTDAVRVGELRTAANRSQIQADALEAQIRAVLTPEAMPTLDSWVETHHQQIDSLNLALETEQGNTWAEKNRGDAAVALNFQLTDQVKVLTEEKRLALQANETLRLAIEETRIEGITDRLKAGGPILMIVGGVIIVASIL